MMYQWKCKSGELIISDPSFTKADAKKENNIWMLGKHLVNVKKGTWTTKMSIGKILDWGTRVTKVISNTNGVANGKKDIFTLGVDTGQMSTIDYSAYPDGNTGEYGDTSFYGKCCKLTSENFGDTFDGRGFVSRSGIGDGCYEGVATRNMSGQVVHVEINFVHDKLPEKTNLAQL